MQTRTQTCDIGSSGALVEVEVVIRDLTIGIAVDEHTFQRFAILVVHLLIDIERIGRMTNGMSLYGVTCTSRDATSLDDGRLTGKLGNLIFIIGEVTCDLPLPVFSTNRTYGERSLDTAVLQ